MKTMNIPGESGASNPGRNRICWYDLFQYDMEWLAGLALLNTNDATLGLASIIAAYCDLAGGGPLVLETEAALKMVRARVIAQCDMLAIRWQHDPGWCGRRFASLSPGLRLPFIAYIVMGWHEEKARYILQDPDVSLAALVTDATSYFNGSRYTPDYPLFARFFLTERWGRNTIPTTS